MFESNEKEKENSQSGNMLVNIVKACLRNMKQINEQNAQSTKPRCECSIKFRGKLSIHAS